MAATIYELPDKFKAQVPCASMIVESLEKYESLNIKLINNLSNFCKSGDVPNQYIGEVLRIPHADGYAQYMVALMSPLMLISLPIGDAWDSPFANLLTANKVKEMIDADKLSS